MMSEGFFETFKKYLSQFKDIQRTKEFKEFLIALAEWRITQIVLEMLKQGITNFGPLTPDFLSFRFLSPESEEIAKRERLDPNEWEYNYLKAYRKLYDMYDRVVLTFPKKEQGIFYMHNIPPTSLYKYLYDQFFPSETEKIIKEYKGKEIIRW